MSRARDALTWLPSEDEGPAPSGKKTEADLGPPTFAFDALRRFRVADVEFHCSAQLGSRADRFFIRKDRALVEEYLDVLDEFQEANVVELGIAQGGSAALMALVSAPGKLVALELQERRVEALDELIGRLGLDERIRPYYGVDQSDRARLRAVIDAEFADEPLDLVIDDASHRFEETRASFETLFPRLRPGGLYMIEDWHQQVLGRALEEAIADPDSATRADLERRLAARASAPREGAAVRRGPPQGNEVATALILQLVLAQAESDEFLAEVAIGPRLVRIRRGAGGLDAATFRLSDLFSDYLGVLSPPPESPI